MISNLVYFYNQSIFDWWLNQILCVSYITQSVFVKFGNGPVINEDTMY